MSKIQNSRPDPLASLIQNSRPDPLPDPLPAQHYYQEPGQEKEASVSGEKAQAGPQVAQGLLQQVAGEGEVDKYK